MSLLGRIRLFPPAPADAPRPPAVSVAAAPVAVAGPELGDDDLEKVVGGLERIYVFRASAD